ncbi:MAG: hypothetical protein E7474_07290 [Ruminococcaceae bacterium]|nr:hypothetical protein [Oscillospiraceae bacterium]
MTGEVGDRLLVHAAVEQGGHIREARLDFLCDQIPDLEDFFPLLSDFRFGGYRILGDLICDVDDENNAEKNRKLHRPRDSEAFQAMMQAYLDKPRSQSYKDAVAKVCRKRLDKIVKPHFAVRRINRNLSQETILNYFSKIQGFRHMSDLPTRT